MDPAVRTGGDSGTPVTATQPETAVARALRQIAMDLAAQVSVAAVQQNSFIPINLVG
jgi:ATP-binding protein involved in chromosome partitioning